MIKSSCLYSMHLPGNYARACEGPRITPVMSEFEKMAANFDFLLCVIRARPGSICRYLCGQRKVDILFDESEVTDLRSHLIEEFRRVLHQALGNRST